MNKTPMSLIKLRKEKLKGSGRMKNIKKNQIVIYVIALMLVAVGYLSYNINQETIETSSRNENDENIGEAEFVSSNDLVENSSNGNGQAIENVDYTGSSEDTKNEINSSQAEVDLDVETTAETADEYFANSKLERDRMYSQTIETYQNILDSSNSSEEQKSIATQEITSINDIQNGIMICENLIALKGVSNSVIFVNGDSVSVVLEADELEQSLVAQIQNIITRELNADIENIHILSK
jgi:stage III sporulation protein AH